MAVSAPHPGTGNQMALGADRRDVLSMVLRQGYDTDRRPEFPIGPGGITLRITGVRSLSRNAPVDVEATGSDDGFGHGTRGSSRCRATSATLVPANRATRIDPVAGLR